MLTVRTLEWSYVEGFWSFTTFADLELDLLVLHQCAATAA